MFVLKRNQIIITALVIMVAVAGYLNYLDSSAITPNSITLNDDGEVLALVPNNSGNDNVTVSSTVNGVSDGLLVEADEVFMIDDNPEILTEAIKQMTAEQPSEVQIDEPGTAVFVNSSLDSTYFVQAKLDREQARAKQKEILTEMINNTNIEQGKRADCATAMLEIQKRIEKETAAEAMIEAKGFSEVYVRIDDDTVDVVVSKETLSDAEIAQIEDIVKRKTGMTADKIRISPIKK